LSSNTVIPSADQLAVSRTQQWHQNGEALLTFENVRSWINAAGLALFAPRAAQLPAPAPSMVEAVLGAANSAPTLADTEPARALLARLIAEGAAVPLSLLGNPTGVGTETPDFIAATAVLPYIFTLRGDKSWKLPPETSGASKVSPLALATFTLLTERAKDPIPGLSAYALATQLGKEVTETAVLRALTELWQHLRVLPIPQEGAATLWELTTTRFTKLLKAGSNAGQPTALSALISLYLGQAIVATEEEIELFLSPLAARSRIRDVVHALLAARQLETIAIEGKTVLHVTGSLPSFATASAEAVAIPVDDIGGLVVTTEGDLPVEGDLTPQPRIKKFVPAPRKIGTGFVRKPFAERVSPRERRPFTRESNRPDRPSFTKPWAEEKADRLAAARAPAQADETSAPPAYEKRPGYDRKPGFDRRPGFGSKPSFSRKPSFGSKPGFGSKPSYGSNPGYGSKPSYGSNPGFSPRSDRTDSRPPRRDFAPRSNAESGGNPGDFAPRKTFSKPGTFGRKREGGFGPGPSFGRDPEGRPPRREFTPRSGGERPSYGARPERPAFRSRPDRPSNGARPSYPPRESGPGESAGPRFRKFDAPRGDRPFNSDRPARSNAGGYTAKPGGYASRSSGAYAGKSSGGFAGKSSSYEGKSSGFGDKQRSGKSSGGYAGKSTGYAGKSGGSAAGKSGGSYAGKSSGPAGKKPGGAGKPAGTFDKFKNNAKPFGKRPPARKWKPEESRSAE
jgi:23S rRNA pseudouridine2605 synthase